MQNIIISITPVNAYHMQHKGKRDTEKNIDFLISLQNITIDIQISFDLNNTVGIQIVTNTTKK